MLTYSCFRSESTVNKSVDTRRSACDWSADPVLVLLRVRNRVQSSTADHSLHGDTNSDVSGDVTMIILMTSPITLIVNLST